MTKTFTKTSYSPWDSILVHLHQDMLDLRGEKAEELPPSEMNFIPYSRIKYPALFMLNSENFLLAPPTVFQLTEATAKPLQSCPTLCDPIDGSPPGSPVPGFLQARTLEWVAISFSNAEK